MTVDKQAIFAQRRNDKRALVFTNLLNGVPEWQVARDFQMAAEDVRATFRFIIKKLRSFAFERREPPIFAETVADAQKARARLIMMLPLVNLDKDPTFSNIQHERMTTGNVETVFRQIR